MHDVSFYSSCVVYRVSARRRTVAVWLFYLRCKVTHILIGVQIKGGRKVENDTFVLKGEVVKVARHLKGIKLNDFAKKVGIDPDYLSKIENGDRGISERNQGLLLRGLIYKLNLSYEEIAAIHILVDYVKGGFKGE